MRRFLGASVPLVLSLLVLASVPARMRAAAPLDIVLQNDGSDWGARINAADAQLGGNPGIIDVQGGGHIATQVVIGSNHTLRFGSGRWTNSNVNETFLLKDHTVLEGHGWDTVIQEPPGNNPSSYFVVKPYGTARIDAAGQVRDITVSNIQISGVDIDKAPNGAQMTFNTGLLADGAFRHLWFNRTHAIGREIGEINTHGNVVFNSEAYRTWLRLGAGDVLRVAQLAARLQFARPQFGAIPRHVGMIPAEPCQARTIRTEVRR